MQSFLGIIIPLTQSGISYRVQAFGERARAQVSPGAHDSGSISFSSRSRPQPDGSWAARYNIPAFISDPSRHYLNGL